MEKGKVKDLNGFLLSLMAVIYILSFITAVAYTKAGRPITLTNATVTDSEADTQLLLSESELKALSILDEYRLSSIENQSSRNSQMNQDSSGQWQTKRMRVTAYCPCPKCCGQYSDGVTASGHKIQPGDTFVAADKRFSFGTEMVIAGYNNGQLVKVLDRGGAIRGNRLDLFFGTHQEALEWGVKHLDVRIREK
ncbi:MAG: 3D domain-containing protein [Planctomycetota bacterium]